MSDFSELLQKAEQLSAEFGSTGNDSDIILGPRTIRSDLPRVDRNLKQLVEAGQQLFSKTKKTHAGINLGSQDVKASVLLGSRGVDLQGMTTKLDTLTAAVSASDRERSFTPIEPAQDTDVAGFLRNERENAILAVVAETRLDTFKNADRLHWESTLNEWESEKQKIITNLSGGVYGLDNHPNLDALAELSIPISKLSRVHDSTIDVRSRLDLLEKAYSSKLMKYREISVEDAGRADLIKEFIRCLSDLVLETGEYELLLGCVLENGTKAPGLISQLAKDFAENLPQKVARIVAKDSEKRGMFEDSVRLYDLANNHEKVISLLNKLLVQVVAEPNIPDSRRDHLQRNAIDIARRYRLLGHNASKDETSTFFLLLDLMTFFDTFHSRLNDVALDIISKVKVVPLAQGDVDTMVATFRILPDEIRRLIPDVLLATMNLLLNKFKTIKAELPIASITTGSHLSRKNSDGGTESYLEGLRDQAKALITFAGMIPYRMPGDTNAKLVQMEVQMN